MSIMSDAPTPPNGGKWELTYWTDYYHDRWDPNNTNIANGSSLRVVPYDINTK